MEAVTDFIFLASKITVDSDCSHERKGHQLLGRKGMTNLNSMLKSRDIILPTNVWFFHNQSYGFSSSHVWIWELDHKEGWCFQIVVLGKVLKSPLDRKENKPVNPKGNQLWLFIGRTDTEAEAPILWPPDVASSLTGKAPDAGTTESKSRRGQQRMRWLDGITDSMDMNLSKLH